MADFSPQGWVVLLVFGALAAFMKDQFIFLFKVLYSYFFLVGKEYNLDGNKDTPDWCETNVTGTTVWGLTKITKYRLLYVDTEMQGEDGEIHKRDIPILDWLLGKSGRRHVSVTQAGAIRRAGNNWPTLTKLPTDTDQASNDIDSLVVAVEKMASNVANKGDIDEVKRSLDVKEMIEEAMSEFRDWKNKRPIELGKVKARVARLEENFGCNCKNEEKPGAK